MQQRFTDKRYILDATHGIANDDALFQAHYKILKCYGLAHLQFADVEDKDIADCASAIRRLRDGTLTVRDVMSENIAESH